VGERGRQLFSQENYQPSTAGGQGEEAFLTTVQMLWQDACVARRPRNNSHKRSNQSGRTSQRVCVTGSGCLRRGTALPNLWKRVSVFVCETHAPRIGAGQSPPPVAAPGYRPPDPLRSKERNNKNARNMIGDHNMRQMGAQCTLINQNQEAPQRTGPVRVM